MTPEKGLKQALTGQSTEMSPETFQRKWLAELRSEMEVGIVLTIVEKLPLY